MAGPAAGGRAAAGARRPGALPQGAVPGRGNASRWTPPSSTCPSGCWARNGRCWTRSSPRATGWPRRSIAWSCWGSAAPTWAPGRCSRPAATRTTTSFRGSGAAAGRESISRATTSTTTPCRGCWIWSKARDDWGIVVISKSGGTLETAVAFRLFLEELRKACGGDAEKLPQPGHRRHRRHRPAERAGRGHRLPERLSRFPTAWAGGSRSSAPWACCRRRSWASTSATCWKARPR